jgi:hypothetical protein
LVTTIPLRLTTPFPVTIAPQKSQGVRFVLNVAALLINHRRRTALVGASHLDADRIWSIRSVTILIA